MPTLKSIYCICKLLVGLTARFFGGLKALKRESDPAMCIGGDVRLAFGGP
jgi:hypothetical protein